MGSKSDAVKNWRKRTKARIIEAMGGQCVCCGYDRCHRAMDLHHLNPHEKEFGIANMRANIRSWDKVVEEIRKCVLVCCRCHAEIHDGLTQVPDEATRFKESFVNYKEVATLTPCVVCGAEKPQHNKTCSRSCAAKLSRKVDWDSIDLKQILNQMSYVKAAELLGVSDVAVRKRAKKIGAI